MSKPEAAEPSQQRRLGLLQCPNASLLGWGGDANSPPQITEDHPTADDQKPLDADVKTDVNATVFIDADVNASEGRKSAELSASAATPDQRNNKMDIEEKLESLQNNATPDPSTPKTEITNNDDGNDANSTSSLKRPRMVDPIDETKLNVSRARKENNTNEKNVVKFQKEEPTNGIADSKTEAELVSLKTSGQVDKNKSSPKGTTKKPLHVTASLEYETNCPFTDPASSNTNNSSINTNKNEGTKKYAMERTQVLTITFHGGHANIDPNSSIVVGTISGKARLEILPPFENDDCKQHVNGNEDDTLSLHSNSISLDVFGYRLPREEQCDDNDVNFSNNNSIIINRPSWMNSLPLSVVCNDSRDSKEDMPPAKLRVRIHSLNNDENEVPPLDDTGDYYSAYPEESYCLRILPPHAIYPDNDTAAGCGVSTILKPWKNIVDKIVNVMVCNGGAPELENRSQTDDCEIIQKSTEISTLQLMSPRTNQNRMLLCGAKGVGKSTFLRYAINRVLSAQSCPNRGNVSFKEYPRRVAILDIDSGQPELSPPGMISLTVVSRPLLSDPPMHMVCGGNCDHNDETTSEFMEHEAAYFFGDITSKADPDTFIQMSSQLMQRYETLNEAEDHSLPLLVNTDGWVKGFGFEILSAIIGTINPGHIIQILGNTKAKSFDMSSHIVSPSGSISNNVSTIQQRSVHVIQSFDASNINEFDDGGTKSRRMSDSSGYAESSTGTLSATASDHRIHRICAYFLGGYEEMTKLRSDILGENDPITFNIDKGVVDHNNIIGLTLASMSPYAVPFHSVRLFPPSGLLDSSSEMNPTWGVNGDLASSSVLDSLNGSIVGLCCNADEHDTPLAGCNAGIGAPVICCVGLGIIRSIDRVRRIFFVITPVHHNSLVKVTSLVGGNIGLPLECVFRGVQSDSFPFLTCAHSLTNPGLGADAMRSRNHSGRHGNNK